MFGTNMRARRRALGVSAKELARDVGKSVPMVYYYETGEKTPSLALAIRIAQALRTTVDALFYGDGA